MQVTLRRAYGYAYGPPYRFRGLRGLGDTCDDGSTASGGICDDGSLPIGIITGNDPGIAPVPIIMPNPTTLLCPDGSAPFSDGTCTETPSMPLGATVVDSSGITWHCDSKGNCCDPTNNCIQGAPTPSATSASTAAQVNALAKASQGVYGAASAATVAAQVAAAIAKAVAPLTGTTCPAGYVYGAPGQSVQLGPGVATVGAGKCIPMIGAAGSPSLIPGVSNTTLGIAAVVVFALFMMGGKRR
jgi:hypothetical protein